jgi:hypothetical protein
MNIGSNAVHVADIFVNYERVNQKNSPDSSISQKKCSENILINSFFIIKIPCVFFQLLITWKT